MNSSRTQFVRQTLPICFIAISMACATAFAAPPEDDKTSTTAVAQPVRSIPHADVAVTIDGKLDEPVWQSARSVNVDHVAGKLGARAAKVPMTVRYAWDENYLYIGYEVFDTNLVAIPSGIEEGPANNRRAGATIFIPGQKVDVVEFFIGFEDPHFFWEIHQNAANEFNDVWCIVPEKDWPFAESSSVTYGIYFGFADYLKDDNEFTFAKAVQLKPTASGKLSTINNPDDIDTGYTAELRLPWRSLGAPRSWLEVPKHQNDPPKWLPAGHSLSILAVLQDGDLKERYHTDSPTYPGGWFHTNFSDWPRHVLSAEPTTQAVEPTTGKQDIHQ